MSKGSTEIVKREDAELAILNPEVDAEEVFEALANNLEDTELRPYDQITIPAGGGTMWNLPDLEDPDGKDVKEIIGVPLTTQKQRNYWAVSIEDGGGGRPDCSSADGIVGEGMFGVDSEMAEVNNNPRGLCKLCPMAVWERTPEGRNIKSPCNEYTLLFVLQEGGGVMPLGLRLTGTSAGVWHNFAHALGMKGYHYNSVVVRFGLEKDKNAQGQTFAKLKCTLDRRITKGQKQAVLGVRAQFERDLLQKVSKQFVDDGGRLEAAVAREALPGVSDL